MKIAVVGESLVSALLALYLSQKADLTYFSCGSKFNRPLIRFPLVEQFSREVFLEAESGLELRTVGGQLEKLIGGLAGCLQIDLRDSSGLLIMGQKDSVKPGDFQMDFNGLETELLKGKKLRKQQPFLANFIQRGIRLRSFEKIVINRLDKRLKNNLQFCPEGRPFLPGSNHDSTGVMVSHPNLPCGSGEFDRFIGLGVGGADLLSRKMVDSEWDLERQPYMELRVRQTKIYGPVLTDRLTIYPDGEGFIRIVHNSPLSGRSRQVMSSELLEMLHGSYELFPGFYEEEFVESKVKLRVICNKTWRPEISGTRKLLLISDGAASELYFLNDIFQQIEEVLFGSDRIEIKR